MTNEEARIRAAAALRDLVHTFASSEPDEDTLLALETAAAQQAATLRDAKRRDRFALMHAAVERDGFPMMKAASGFGDRAVGGDANPTGLDFDVRYEDDEVVVDVVLRRAFEGAPGRAHGGIVAAAFDDVTGFVIGQVREPAFTGELTVRYLAPVPVDELLELRARLDGRERRKLFISAEARHGDQIIATCRAIYITVDPARFAGFPDPR